MIEVKDGSTLLGYVEQEPEQDGARWKSWRPQDLLPPNEGPIGVHQDQPQAEAYLRQLAAHAPTVPTGLTPSA